MELTKREHFAIEIFKGMLSNPVLIQGSIDVLRLKSIDEAQKLIKDLDDADKPQTPKPTLVL